MLARASRGMGDCMASVGWYLRRLRAMSAREVAWRLRAAVRGRLDRALLAWRRRPAWSARRLRLDDLGAPGFSVCDTPPGAWNAGGAAPRAWRERLVSRAEDLLAGRLPLFDLDAAHLGQSPDWNGDLKFDVACPLRFAESIDYRDFTQVGDAKFVWEPSRHHHLVVLGRAYRATGEVRYAQAVARHLESWLDQCPFGLGMQWRSPLELGVRLINWVWALDLIRPSGFPAPELRRRILDAVYRQLWDITRKFSRGSSANNHLIGEAAGTFVAASYFRRWLRDGDGWRRESLTILLQEIERQVFPDGGCREQAFGYHLFDLQFFTIAAIVAGRTGADVGDAYRERLKRMFEYAAGLIEGGEDWPNFGDNDDGYVLDLGEGGRDPRGWLAVGAALYDLADCRGESRGAEEAAWWLLGPCSVRRGTDATDERVRLSCRAFPDSGLYLLQSGERGTDARISVTFDCGPHGYTATAAHGHADALAFTLRAFGLDVVVDPGTYDYFSFPGWRDWARSTRAHATIEVDGRDQSEMCGPFLWGRQALAKCLTFEPGPHGGRVVGEHHGYRRLADPVIHRRTLALDSRRRLLTVRDDILCAARHSISWILPLSEHCRSVSPEGSNRFRADFARGAVWIRLDERLCVDVLRGGEDPIAGWVSRGYHRRSPAFVLVGRMTCDGRTSLRTSILIEPVRRAPAAAEPATRFAKARD